MPYKNSKCEIHQGKMRYKNLHDFFCSSSIYFSSVQMTEDEMNGLFARIRERRGMRKTSVEDF